MGQVVTLNRVLWESDGTAAIPNLASGVSRWIGPSKQLVSADATTNWIKLDVTGTDKLLIQYRGVVLNFGGASGVTGCSMTFTAVGNHFEESDPTLVPTAVSVAPGAATATQLLPGSLQFRIGLPTYNVGATGYAVRYNNTHSTQVHDQTLFNINGSPSAPETVAWDILLGSISSASTGASSVPYTTTATNMNYNDPWYVKDLQTVWIAMSLFQTLTGGTPANVRLRGKMRVVGLRESTVIDTQNAPTYAARYG